MKQTLITDVIQGMLPYLNNAQTERLQEVLQHTLFDYEVTKTESCLLYTSPRPRDRQKCRMPSSA